MTKNARKNYIKAVSQQVNRKKMYKAKKNWVVAGMSFLVMTGLAAVDSHLTTHADAINANSKPNTIKQPSITDQATQLHNKILNNNTYKLGVQPKQSSAVAKQNTKSSNSNVDNTPAQSSATNDNSAKAVKNNKVNIQVNNNTKQNSTNVKNNQVEQSSTKANNSLSNNLTKQPNANSSSASANTNKGVKSSKLANNSLNKNKEPLIKAHINLGDSNDAQSRASDGHWIYDNDKYISSMPSTDSISDGTYDGLSYKYDKTLQALEFTGGEINVSDTSDFLGVPQFSGFNGQQNNTLKSVKFDSDVDTSKVINMNGMFYSNSVLQSLDLSHFDTSKVTNMSDMFLGDSALTSLDLGSHFDTSKVTDMSAVFASDNALQSLDLSHFDTSKVTNMSDMFLGDSALTSLDLGSHFDTSNVTNMSNIFGRDSALTSLDLGSHFDTSKVTNMSDMFLGDSDLQSLTIQSSSTKISGNNGLPTMYEETGSDDANGNPYTLGTPNDFSQGNVGTFTTNKNAVVTDTIQYVNSHNYNEVISSDFKVSGVSDTTTSINWYDYGYNKMPANWNIDTSVNSNPQFTYDGGTHTVYIAPNHTSDNVQYQYNGQILGTHDFGGNNAGAQGASDTGFTIGSDPTGLPYGYHVDNPSQYISYWGGNYPVQISPTMINATVNYQLNGSTVKTIGITGQLGTNAQSQVDANTPQYYYVSANDSYVYWNGNNIINVDVQPDSAYLTVNYKCNGQQLGSYTFHDRDGRTQHSSYSTAVQYDNNGSNSWNGYIVHVNKNGGDWDGVPAHYHVTDTSTIYPEDDDSVDINIAPDTMTQNINYVWYGQNKGTTTMNGAYNTQGSVNGNGLNAGWHVNDDGSQNFTFNGGTQYVDILPNTVTDYIHYTGDGANTWIDINGNDYRTGVNGTVTITNGNCPSIPANYHVNNNQTFNFDGGNHDVYVTRNNVSEYINYVWYGQSKGTTTMNSRYGLTGSANGNGLDTGWHVNDDGSQNFTFNGGTQNVDILPNQDNDYVDYWYNGQVLSTSSDITGNDVNTGVNGTFTISNGYAPKLPSGYHIVSGDGIGNNGLTFNHMDAHHRVNIAPNTVTDTISFHDIYSSDGEGYPSNIQVTGLPSNNYTVSAPQGWALVNSDGTIASGTNNVGNDSKSFSYGSGNQTLDVAPVYKGLTYKYDKTLQALEFTGGTLTWNGSLSSYFIGYNSSNKMNYAPKNIIATKLKSIKFDSDIDTSNVTNMNSMFSSDTGLQTLDLGNHFDTGNVTNMNNMFNNDESLTSLDLGNHFDTSNVTNMNAMFSNNKLQSLDLGDKFNTNKVLNMSDMFDDDIHLQSLNLGNHFDTSNVTNMNEMFNSDLTLRSLDLGNKFNTSNVTNMSDMFESDSDSLHTLIIQSPNTKISDRNGSDGLPTMYKQLSEKDNNGNNYTLATPNNFGLGNMGTFVTSANIPLDTVNYQCNGNTLATQQFKGDAQHYNGNGYNDLDINKSDGTSVPSGYHLVNTDNNIPFNTGTYNIAITPNVTTDTINFINQNNQNMGTTTATGTPNTSFTISNIPNGYHVDTSKNPNTLTYDGNTHTVDVIGNQVSGTATVNVAYKETNGTTDDKVSDTVSIDNIVGNTVTINPLNYWKENYRPTSFTPVTHTLTATDASNGYSPTINFSDVGKTAADLVIQYVDVTQGHDTKHQSTYTQDLGSLGVVGKIVDLGRTGANDGHKDILDIPAYSQLAHSDNPIMLTDGNVVTGTSKLALIRPDLVGHRVMLLTCGVNPQAKDAKPSASAKPASTEAKHSSVSSVSKSVASSVASNIAKPSSNSLAKSSAVSSKASSKNSSASSVASQSASSSASSVESSTDFKSVVNSLNQQLSELSLAMNNEVSSAFSMNNSASASSTPSSAVQSTSSSADSGLVNFDDDRLYKVVEAPQVVMHKVGRHECNKHLLIVHFRKHHVLFLERHHGFVMTLRRHNKISVRKIRYIHIHHGRVVIRLRNGRYVKVSRRYFHRIRKFLRK